MAFLPSDLLVPKPLFGNRAQVRRAWLRVTMRALQDGTWKNVLEDMDYLTLAECPEDIITNIPSRYNGPGDFWQLYLVHSLLRVGCDKLFGVRTDEDQRLICSLNWEGLRYPWFVMSAFCSQGSGIPAFEDEHMQFAHRALDIIMQWWDCFCLLDQRFRSGYSRGWPGWSSYIMKLLRYLSLPMEQARQINFVPPEAAGDMIREWIENGVIPRPK